MAGIQPAKDGTKAEILLDMLFANPAGRDLAAG